MYVYVCMFMYIYIYIYNIRLHTQGGHTLGQPFSSAAKLFAARDREEQDVARAARREVSPSPREGKQGTLQKA